MIELRSQLAPEISQPGNLLFAISLLAGGFLNPRAQHGLTRLNFLSLAFETDNFPNQHLAVLSRAINGFSQLAQLFIGNYRLFFRFDFRHRQPAHALLQGHYACRNLRRVVLRVLNLFRQNQRVTLDFPEIAA